MVSVPQSPTIADYRFLQMNAREAVIATYDAVMRSSPQGGVRYVDMGNSLSAISISRQRADQKEARIGYLRRMAMRAVCVYFVCCLVLSVGLMGLLDYLVTGSSLLHPAFSLLLLAWGAFAVSVALFAVFYSRKHIMRLRSELG